MEINTIIIIFVVILILLGISIGVFFMMKKSKSIIAPTSSTPSPSSTNIRPSPSSTNIRPSPSSSTITPTASTITPTASTITPTASTITPTASTITPTASTITPTASTNWSIVKIDNSYIVARKNSNGDVEALINDANNIIWYSSEADANQAITESITLSNMKPFPSHWCTQLRAPLGLPPTAPTLSLTNWAGNSYHIDGATCGPNNNNTACTGNRCCSEYGMCGGNTGGEDDWCNYFHGFEGKYDAEKPQQGKEGKHW
jgi:hypothetical protein